jgi:hypothetical protein
MAWAVWTGVVAAGGSLLAVGGCYNTPVDTSEYARGPAPLRMPSPAREGDCCFEDSLNGAKVFDMYCVQCHDRRTLAERPFSNYKNVAAHMHARVNLTGKEYAELVAWMRRWADVPPPNPPPEPSPKRLIFSQPLNELREQQEGAGKEGAGKAGPDKTGPDKLPAEMLPPPDKGTPK